MTVENMITALAGIIVLLTTVLFLIYRVDWILYITAFIGFNLLQSSFTGFCPPAYLFKAMGFKTAAEKAKESSAA